MWICLFQNRGLRVSIRFFIHRKTVQIIHRKTVQTHRKKCIEMRPIRWREQAELLGFPQLNIQVVVSGIVLVQHGTSPRTIQPHTNCVWLFWGNQCCSILIEATISCACFQRSRKTAFPSHCERDRYRYPK